MYRRRYLTEREREETREGERGGDTSYALILGWDPGPHRQTLKDTFKSEREREREREGETERERLHVCTNVALPVCRVCMFLLLAPGHE